MTAADFTSVKEWTQAGVAVLVAALFAGFLYINWVQEESRAAREERMQQAKDDREAARQDRLDEERSLLMQIITQSITTQEQYQKDSALRAVEFLRSQKAMEEQGRAMVAQGEIMQSLLERQADAMARQASAIENLQDSHDARVNRLKGVMREENQKLIEVLKLPPNKRKNTD